LAKTTLLPPARGLTGEIAVPPSKSYTHRAITMAALARGTSRVADPLISRDTNATILACQAFGARVEPEGDTLLVKGCAPRTPEDVVNVENSGTTLRFMTSVLAVAPQGHSVLTGDASIRRRPMQPLLQTLKGLGVNAWSTRGNGCAPIIVEGGGLEGGEVEMRGDVSSQFVSSILISSPLARGETDLRVKGAVSRPYIEATLFLSRKFGINVERHGYERFVIPARQRYKPQRFTVPGDFSSASFVVAATALVGGSVVIRGLDSSVPQGDSLIIDIASKMGVAVRTEHDSLSVSSDGGMLTGGTFNLSDTPDLLPVVSVLALKCTSKVRVVGVAHARFKETDRIAVMAGELSKLGVGIAESADGLVIDPPRKLHSATLDAHDDHRMFMAFALASMLVPGGSPVVGVESLDVSYPGFLDDMKRLGARVRREE
jgi:3-phosphoshikimate 1-carboxyvinyltransferase